MDILARNDYHKIIAFYDAYTHNQALIYSVLEGQYDGVVFVDNVDQPTMSLLCTPFDHHFVAGMVNAQSGEFIRKMMKDYTTSHKKEEFVLFAPTKDWHKVASDTFKQFNGILTTRLIYQLDQERFKTIYKNYTLKNSVEYTHKDDELSHKAYPYAAIVKDQGVASYCKAFAVGNHYGELDVSTAMDHRKKGFAFEVALVLIHELLENKIEPLWNIWPYREGSKKLAEKLGFTLEKEEPAYVWVKDECLSL